MNTGWQPNQAFSFINMIVGIGRTSGNNGVTPGHYQTTRSIRFAKTVSTASGQARTSEVLITMLLPIHSLRNFSRWAKPRIRFPAMPSGKSVRIHPETYGLEPKMQDLIKWICLPVELPATSRLATHIASPIQTSTDFWARVTHFGSAHLNTGWIYWTSTPEKSSIIMTPKIA